MTHDHHAAKDKNSGFVGLLSWCVGNARTVVIALTVVCTLLLLSDLIYHKHVHFAFEEWFGIFGIFGFVVYTVIVLLAKSLRRVIMRPEDYWGERSIASEEALPVAEDENRGDGHA